jgi:L-threonylcarbamoyladenylate synthase
MTNPPPGELLSLAAALRRGEVLAYPTEAVFGLGCDPKHADALRKLISLKQRDPGQGLLLIGATFDHVAEFIDRSATPQEVLRKVQSARPVPTTWVVPASRAVHPLLRGTHSGIAVRITSHAGAASLCQAFGGALVSTSANPHGHEPARDVDQVSKYFPNILVMRGDVDRSARPSRIIDALSGRTLRA